MIPTLSQRTSPITLNRGQLLAQGLLGFLPLNEGGGKVIFNGIGRTGPGASTTSAWSQSPLGNALLFNGTSDKVDFGNTMDMPGNAMAFSAWVNAISVTGNRTILSKFGDVSFQNSYIFRVESNALKLYICNAGAGSFASVAGATTLSTGVNYHVAASWDGVTAKIYLNGVLDGSGSIGGTYQTCAATFKIGMGGALTNENWSGYIKHVHIFSRPISANEVVQLCSYPYSMLQRRATRDIIGYVAPAARRRLFMTFSN